MWTPDLEVNLFHALKGHKPTGINRHFHMACVHHKLITASREIKDQLSPDLVWIHLKNMYNLDTLNELDELPFPNGEVEFALPDEMMNPVDFMSNPSSPVLSVTSPDESGSALTPAVSTTAGAVPARPSNLHLTTGLITTESLSPKRKRNARQSQLSTSSQPSSPASTPGSTSKRRR